MKKIRFFLHEHKFFFVPKIFLYMKLTTLFLVISLESIAAHGYSQTENVTVKLKDSNLKEFFNTIEKQTSYKFLYSDDAVGEINVNIDETDKPLDNILNDIFKGSGFSFKLMPNNLIVIAPVDLLQQITVTGTISDENGNPLPGVNIQVEGTTIGINSDINGKYSISLQNAYGVLIFSFIGYNTQKVPIAGKMEINVKLNPAVSTLGEVVITALGIRREKKALTYSVTEVTGESITKARELNIGNALSGIVAGVTASGTTGGPAASSRVIVRGNGSLNGDNQPLYVINGMPISNNNIASAGTYGGIDRGDGLSSINPDDIATISVLKGGTASALYGSRASNGVILITTKAGIGHKGIGVQYSTTYTLEKVNNMLDWQDKYGAGTGGLAPTTKAEAIAYGRTSWGAKLDGSMVIQPDGELRQYIVQKNNIKNFYQNGSTFSNTIALTGGSETTNFRFSASNVDNKGNVPNNTFNRKTFDLSVKSTLSKKIVFEGNAQYSIEDAKNRTTISGYKSNPNYSLDLVATNIDVRTLGPGYQADGNEMIWNDYVYCTNPYFVINKIINRDTRRRFISSFDTRYNITDFFYARARVGLDQANIEGRNITPTGTAFQPKGTMTEDQGAQIETNIEASLGFNKELGLFSVNVIAGGNQMGSTYKTTGLSSGNFNLPFQYFISNGSSQTFSKTFTQVAINSLFASADIDFKKYLYLSLTGRNDWFSTLTPKSNNLFYPSVGFSFLASEVWKTKPGWLDYAKFRTSWAQVGGGSPDPYALNQTFTAQANTYSGQTLMNITSSTIPALLTPYTSTTYETGIETKLFNNRLGLDLTVYNRTTTNDIVNAAIPSSSGYNALALNVGKMKNQGVEIMLTGRPIESEIGVNWDITVMSAYNKNEIIKIAEGLTSVQIAGGVARTLNGWVYNFEGQAFGMIAGFKQLKDANGQLVFNSTSGLPVAGPLEALGRGVPPLSLSLNNNFRYKNFNLGFLIDSRWGGSIYSVTSATGTYYGLDKLTTDNNSRETGISVSGVDQNGTPYNATISAEKYYKGIAFNITDYFVESADFIKLRSFTFGYNLPALILNGTPFESVNLSFVGRNLLILYKASKNVDPESNYNNSNAQGLENFGNPSTRSFGFNLNVVF